MAVSKEDFKKARIDLMKSRGGANPDISPEVKTYIGLDPNKSYSESDILKAGLNDAYQNFGIAKQPKTISPISDQQVLYKKRIAALRLGFYSTMVSGKYGTGKIA